MSNLAHWRRGVSKTALMIGMRHYRPDIQKERWYAFQGARHGA